MKHNLLFFHVDWGWNKNRCRECGYPYPIADAIQIVMEGQEKLEERIKKLESKEGMPIELDKYFEKDRREILQGSLAASKEFSEGGGI